MDMPFVEAERYLSKITASHFSTLTTKIANQNVPKRILITITTRTRLIAMRTSGYVQSTHSTSVQVVGINRPVGTEKSQLQI